MKSSKVLVALGVIVGLIFCWFGWTYATTAAGNLPTWFIGYQTGVTTVHVKHAIASFLLAVACFVFAWFQSGKKKLTA